jgi:hypothetical protein
MAINFNKLKDPKLGWLDKLTFGKLKDCRVCDVIQDHYEYLIWAEKQGYVKFQQIVVETIQETANFSKWEDSIEHNSQDDIKDLYEKVTRIDYDWEDDVPF